MADHDHGYKLLFSHPRMVEQLLRGFVRESWVEELDYSTLEKVSGSYVSDDLREREDDVVWRVRWKREWIYIYLLLEFQSTVDRYMALRLMVYVGLLYQDLQRSGRLPEGGRLPPVLPLVLYNGEKRWDAPVDVGDLLQEGPAGLRIYRPRARFLLIDEGAFGEEELKPLQGLVALLFRLENANCAEAIQALVEELIGEIQRSDAQELERAFTVWLRRVLLPARVRVWRFQRFIT